MVLTQILVVHISGCTIVLSKSCFHPQLFIIPWNHGGKVCEVVWPLRSLVTAVSAINVTHNFCSDEGVIFTFNHQYAYSPYCCVFSEVLLGRICSTIIASLIANHFLFFIDIFWLCYFGKGNVLILHKWNVEC